MNFSKETGFLIFRILLPITIFLIQIVLYLQVRQWLTRTKPQSSVLQIALAAPFVLYNAALIVVMLVRPRTLAFPAWFNWLGMYPFFIWHCATFFIGLVLFVGFLVKSPFTIAAAIMKRWTVARKPIEAPIPGNTVQRFDRSRRIFLRRSIYGLTAVSFGASSYGLIHEKTSHDMTTAEFHIPGLSPEFDGLTVGLVSDIHSSIFMTKEDMDEYVKLVNSMNADLIMIPGDFVNSMTEEVYPFAEAFSNLKAPLGIYGVLGNHDFYAPDPDLVAQEVDSCGIKLLRNDRATINRDGAMLYVVGIDDTGRSQLVSQRLQMALKNTEPGIPRILLCHRPYFLKEAADHGVGLVLSGHTHGGQIVLARFGDLTVAPASLASRYVWGKYSLGTTHMYVSRGIGTVGLPIRINCPPEITKITLRIAPYDRQQPYANMGTHDFSQT